jgi:carboxypeptidase family protein
MKRPAVLGVACALALAVSVWAQQSGSSSTRPAPPRDTSARSPESTPPPKGRITGRVVAADSGRPLKRARVFINAAELEDGRGVLTDDSGTFDFTELPAGRYTVTVAKSGFVSLSYGQRRPLQAGTPLQLGDGQQLRNVDFALPRGSVIAGRIADEDGEPMAGVTVRVLRYQYLQGERRLTPVGGGQTDDKGQFRVWGLMPGEYYVNALTRGGFGPGGRGGFFYRNAGPEFATSSGDEQDSLNYAPTYYPGVPSVSDAKPIALGLNQELLDINFSLQLVRMSRIAGRVTNPDGSATTSGQVNLLLDAGGRGNQIGAAFGGRIDWDGGFAINNVPPGRYLLRARGDDTETPQYAVIPVTVSGGTDLADFPVVLTAGATLSGTVLFPSAATSPPDPTQFRVTAPSTDNAMFGPQPNARLDKQGKFILDGVPAGQHLVRSAGAARGWMLKSVVIGGRNVTDAPIELRSGETISNITVEFTDKVNEIQGSVTTDQGTPASEYTVLAFSTDPSLWRPLSRQIATGRPDQTGQYRIRTLPPGEYYVVTVDPGEQGEWFEPAYLEEHRGGAVRVSLGVGEIKRQDFKVLPTRTAAR